MPSSKSKYDPFFSRSLEYLPMAEAFLKHYLPAHLRPLVDFSTLERVDRTHTDAHLSKRHGDIAYRAQMGPQSKLYVCLEHQSQPDFMMPIRSLYYGADLSVPYFRKHKKMPLIVSLVFYQGTPPYPYATQLEDYYTYPAWGKEELSARFNVIEVSNYSDEELLTHGVCAPMELLLKHGRTGKFELPLEAYRSIFEACVALVGDEYIFTMLTYATSLSNQVAGKKIYQLIETLFLDKQAIIMTYGKVLENKGEVRGLRRGMQQGIQQVAKSLLSQLHLDLGAVQRATGLSQKELERLQREAEQE
ncbi:MAG: Rpn family recombination-promoting nuclease/putative transposase [Roseivirga sp.]